jgi:hypothetical protein
MEKLGIIDGFEDNLQALKLDSRVKFERNKKIMDEKLLVIDDNIKVVEDNLRMVFKEITKFLKVMFERIIESNNSKEYRLRWDFRATCS